MFHVLYVLPYIHALAEKYLLLHKPKNHDFQSYMAHSTSDGARPDAITERQVDSYKENRFKTKHTNI